MKRYQIHASYKGYKLILTTEGFEPINKKLVGEIRTIPESRKKRELAYIVKGGWKADNITFVPVPG